MPQDWADEEVRRIASEIRRLRGTKRSAQWLADRTKELGYEVKRSVIADLENGRRKYITVAEVVILAQALDTVPLALIYPGPYDDKIDVFPGFEMPQVWAARWFSGELRTVSEVSFDNEGHYVKVPHAHAYSANIRRINDARRAAYLYDEKASLMREINTMKRQQEAGESIDEGELQTFVRDVVSHQQEIDYLLRTQDEESSESSRGFETLRDTGREPEDLSDGG